MGATLTMGALLGEIGKQLAQRWAASLVLPGMLFLAAMLASWNLGHTHPFDAGRLTAAFDHWAAAPALNTTGGLVLILMVVFVAAGAVGIMVQGIGLVTERIWLAVAWESWPSPLRRVGAQQVARRRRQWEAAATAYREERDRAARCRSLAALAQRDALQPPPALGVAPTLAERRRRLVRIAPELPVQPTWMGDRIHAVTLTLDREFSLDLPSVWPYLWLTLPDATRAEMTATREALGRAATLAAWGLLYLVAGALWWPSAVVGVLVYVTAWRRARGAAEGYALLLEAAARLHTREVAHQLGLQTDTMLNRQTGWALTCLVQGRSDLIPLTDDAL
ncbi:hypothetical protein ACIRP7_45460 [Streptomyces sp. NPDC102270]|uniref:hypothetical protein n=1 Tax=Streptomyces sp. NPDC102270 TaxID=3366150 RepID=UPI00382D7154